MQLLKVRYAACFCIVTMGWMCADTTAAPTMDKLAIGLGGVFKVGCWTPVTVTLTGDGQPHKVHVEVIVPDDEGVPCRYIGSEQDYVDLLPGQTVQVTRHVRFGHLACPVTVELTTDQGERLAKTWSSSDLPAAVPTHQPVILVAGSTLDVSNLAGRIGGSGRTSVRIAHVSTVTELPHAWYDYDGIDLIVLTTGSPDFVLQLSDDHVAALRRWLELGGRIVIAAGQHAEALLGPQSPVRELVPGGLVRVSRVLQTNALEDYAATNERLDLLLEGTRDDSAVRPAGLPMAILKDIRGAVEVSESIGRENIPLLVHAPFGLGQTTFLAVDLDDGPITRWAGHERLVIKLLRSALPSHRGEVVETTSGRLAHLGFTDLSGQLRAALDQFPGVRLIPFSLIVGIAALYLLLIGPGDFFLLRWLKERMVLTWLTFPLMIVAFCLLALVLAQRWKGNTPRINQVDLVDFDTSRGILRGTTWAHLFSSSIAKYDLRLDVADHVYSDGKTAGLVFSWHGLPGNGFGGMDSPLAPSPIKESYAIADKRSDRGATRTVIDGLPMPMWSSRSVIGRWWSAGSERPIESETGSQLIRDERGFINGEIRNPFAFELQQCRLLFGRWYYEIGNLGAHQRHTVSGTQMPRSLRTLLARRAVVDGNDITTPWDQESLDIPRIMEMVMFHSAAQGQTYTGLSHQQQSWIDLSDHLATGLAILVGRAAGHQAARLKSNHHDFADAAYDSWTFCRVVFTVVPAGDSNEETEG